MDTPAPFPDADPQETREWLDALDGVIKAEGHDRAHFLLESLIDQARRAGANLPFSATTDYINTIPVEQQVKLPGDAAIEEKIRNYARWNAMAMVLRANKHTNVGGHIASYASAATLYDVGFNHFWHAPSDEHGGDLVFVQGHSAPGIYARAFMLGRITAEQLDNFRQEVDGKGISSYPHPWLMPDFWQFPTVSMGLGPLMAIYQARFMKYLQDRGCVDHRGPQGLVLLRRRRDGRAGVDGRDRHGRARAPRQPDLRHQLQPAAARRPGARQRQDHPGARERLPRRRLERDQGHLGHPLGLAARARQVRPAAQADDGGVDGEYQTFKAKDGAYVRKHFFGKYPELLEMVADWTDDDIWALNRGGHDPYKVYAAYHAAVNHKGQPTVILAKTIKGFGMGSAGEAQNITHQQKKMDIAAIRHYRDRFADPDPRRQARRGPVHQLPRGHRRSSSTCASAAWRWAATCRRAGSASSRWRCRRSRRSSGC